MCSAPWPKSAPTRNFSPIGPVVPEIWPNMWGKSQKNRQKERVFKMAKNVGKITKKEREGKSPQNDQKIKENWPLLKN